MAKFGDGGDLLKCSFCGKSQKQVKKLIAGPGVYICDECIDLCNEIIEEELSQSTEVRFDDLPKPREIYDYLNDYIIGQAASAAAVLLASGAPGKRFILPHARVLIHQPHGGASGQAVDIEIQAKEIVRMRELLDEILAFHTGQPLDRVRKDTDRDFIMSGLEARDYGIVDEILTNRELAAVPSAPGTD